MKPYLFLLILLIILISGCISNLNKNQNNLPNTFTINFYRDSTSSGGSRYYNSTLIFINNKLVNGWQNYESWSGIGRHDVYECMFSEATGWIDEEKRACDYYELLLIYNKEQIQEKINSKELKPIDKCSHSDFCYELIK